jgi:sulfate transport system ATP-binding protein
MSILIEEVSKSFGAQLVLDRISFEVAEGELFVMLGASGSGKSTVLRLVAGLSLPNRGRIALAGREVTTLRPQERGTGFVFQNYSVFRHMTVAQNIEFGLKLRGVAGAERARRRDELLDLVGLPGFASREAVQLSGGQQQRVAIARALAYEPKVLLLDEPFGALDVKIRTQLRRRLRAIHDRLGITTLLVTHDQEEAFELADRVGLMDRGRLIEVGRAEELYARPRTLFAATFLGSGAVLVGQVDSGQARFAGVDFQLPVDAHHEEGAPAHLLVRPEDLAVSATAPEGQAVLGSGKLVDQSFAGALRRVRIQLPKPVDIHPASSPPAGPDGRAVDALLTSHEPLPSGDIWVWLRRWHFLDPPVPSLLVADDGRGPIHALKIAGDVARALGARVTVLGVAVDARHSENLGWAIKRRLGRAGITDVEMRVRYGNVATQILNEQAELLSRMVVMTPRAGRLAWLDRLRAGVRRGVRLGKTIVSLLESSRVPVLLVTGEPRALQHMAVVLTDGAEATDLLRTAGRLARALGMFVTMIEIGTEPASDANPGPAPDGVDLEIHSRRRVEYSSLERACADVLAVESDLIVLPVHRRGPQDMNELAPLVTRILGSSDRPVLVVPAMRRMPS